MLLAIFVLTFVTCIVRPDFLALTMLLVLEPPAFVPRSISVVVNSIAVCLVIFPVTVVYVTIGVNQTTSTICFVIFPVSLVKRSINPDLDTTSIFPSLLVPLAFILSSIVKCNHFLGYSNLGVVCRLIVVLEWFERCADLHHKSSCFLNLCVGLSVGCSLVIVHGFCFESVLFFDCSARHYTAIVSLNFSGGSFLVIDLGREVSASCSRGFCVV